LDSQFRKALQYKWKGIRSWKGETCCSHNDRVPTFIGNVITGEGFRRKGLKGSAKRNHIRVNQQKNSKKDKGKEGTESLGERIQRGSFPTKQKEAIHRPGIVETDDTLRNIIVTKRPGHLSRESGRATKTQVVKNVVREWRREIFTCS